MTAYSRSGVRKVFDHRVACVDSADELVTLAREWLPLGKLFLRVDHFLQASKYLSSSSMMHAVERVLSSFDPAILV